MRACVCLCDCMCRRSQKPEESLGFCGAGTMGSCQPSDISARNCPQVLHKSSADSHLLSHCSSSEWGFPWGVQDKYYCSSEHCRVKMIGGMGREFVMWPPTCWNLCRHEETKREKTEECSPGQASRRSKDNRIWLPSQILLWPISPTPSTTHHDNDNNMQNIKNTHKHLSKVSET